MQSGLLRQSLLARASQVARVGRYSEAEVYLADLCSEADAWGPGLDLLARIRAQQGRLGEAESLWRRALVLDPGNDGYQAGLRRIAKIQRRPVWLGGSLAVAAASALVLGVAIAGGMLAQRFARLGTMSRSEAPQPGSEAQTLNERLSTPARAQRDLLPRLRERQPPALTVSIPGVSIKTESSEQVLSFSSGLFPKGTRLTAQAKWTLTSLGVALEPYVGQIEIRVVGYTDDLPVPPGSSYADNFALGLRRAVAVVEHMRATTKLPAGIFSVRSEAGGIAPFSNETRAGRFRNRTVGIRVSAA
jgi:type VI secretion system protein ImpK